MLEGGLCPFLRFWLKCVLFQSGCQFARRLVLHQSVYVLSGWCRITFAMTPCSDRDLLHAPLLYTVETSPLGCHAIGRLLKMSNTLFRGTSPLPSSLAKLWLLRRILRPASGRPAGWCRRHLYLVHRHGSGFALQCACPLLQARRGWR